MSKLLPPVSLFRIPIAPAGSPQTFTYAADGDPGVFDFLGRNYGVAAWTNPFDALYLDIIAVPNTGGDFENTIVDQIQSQFSTDSVTNSIVFDLGVGNALIIDYYSYRYRNDVNTFCPTAWTVEGSNDGSDWSHVVDTVTGEAPDPFPYSKWVSRPILGETLGYRYWRYQMTGNNNSATGHSSIGEFELFGEFSF